MDSARRTSPSLHTFSKKTRQNAKHSSKILLVSWSPVAASSRAWRPPQSSGWPAATGRWTAATSSEPSRGYASSTRTPGTPLTSLGWSERNNSPNANFPGQLGWCLVKAVLDIQSFALIVQLCATKTVRRSGTSRNFWSDLFFPKICVLANHVENAKSEVVFTAISTLKLFVVDMVFLNWILKYITTSVNLRNNST